MYTQPTRWERRIALIEAAAQKGRFSTNLALYPSEYRKLESMGFVLEKPILPFNTQQDITISWKNLTEYWVDKKESILLYCCFQSDKFPETSCFADECFIKAFRRNLDSCPDLAFVQAIKSLF